MAPDVLPYVSSSAADAGSALRLKVVEVTQYVWGGLVLLPSALVLGLSLCILPMHDMLDERGDQGLAIALWMLGFSAGGSMMGWLTIRSARCIARRKSRRFSLTWSLVWAVISLAGVTYELTRVAAMRQVRMSAVHFRGPLTIALVFAVGAVLAIYAFCVLRRESTGALYSAAAEGNTR